MLKYFRKYNNYLIEITYKSGVVKRQWFYHFEYSINIYTKDAECSYSAEHEPIYLNLGEIESIYQIKSLKGRKQWQAS